jgi:hypothetical protein
MSHTLSAAERRHCLEALDRLLIARNQVLGLLIEQVKGGDVNEALDAAVVEVKHAANKLSRHHPDSEVLPLKRWGGIEELGILVDHEQGKTPDMSENDVTEGEKRVIQAMRDHTKEVVSELEKYKAEIEGPNSIERVNESWHLRYQGEAGNYPARQGVGLLAKLLSRPRRSLTVAELVADPAGKLGPVCPLPWYLRTEQAISPECVDSRKTKDTRRMEAPAGDASISR